VVASARGDDVAPIKKQIRVPGESMWRHALDEAQYESVRDHTEDSLPWPQRR
jgi:hypothetical protein